LQTVSTVWTADGSRGAPSKTVGRGAPSRTVGIGRPARRQTSECGRRRGALFPALSLFFSLGAVSTGGCLRPPAVTAPPSKINHAVLVCADSDQQLFDDIKPRFTRLDISRFAETPECLHGKSAVAEIGHTCLNDETSCSTPEYIDGKPLATPISAYDSVLLFTQLLHGSLSAKAVTKTKVINTGGATTGVVPGGATIPTGGTMAETVIVGSGETDYTGELYVFDPRAGELHLGRRFKNIPAERVHDLMFELLRTREP
jgi:hypothetical protein